MPNDVAQFDLCIIEGNLGLLGDGVGLYGLDAMHLRDDNPYRLGRAVSHATGRTQLNGPLSSQCPLAACERYN
jgi:hypothetical protein